MSEWFEIKRGSGQGCVIPPYLFNILAEMVTREILADFDVEVLIGGRRIINPRYADNFIFLALAEAKLKTCTVDQRYSNSGLWERSSPPRGVK